MSLFRSYKFLAVCFKAALTLPSPSPLQSAQTRHAFSFETLDCILKPYEPVSFEAANYKRSKHAITFKLPLY